MQNTLFITSVFTCSVAEQVFAHAKHHVYISYFISYFYISYLYHNGASMYLGLEMYICINTCSVAEHYYTSYISTIKLSEFCCRTLLF